ncbi:hypothetical protein PHMEG_00031494, partial [Phytophthora megakarya]
MEEFYNQIRQWFNPSKHMDVKLKRSSGWNPIRAERSKYCIYAFVNKTSVDQVSKSPDLHGNTCDLHGNRTFTISSLRQVDEYARSEAAMSVNLQPGESRGYLRQQDPDLWFKPADHEVTPEIQRPSKIAEYRRSTTMDLLPGESRGYSKHPAPGKWFRQAKITGQIHNEKAILLLDTGAEVSIVDTAFAPGIRLDLADGSISLPDEVRIHLSGMRQLYGDKAKIVNVGQYLRIQAGESVELPLRLRSVIHDKLWVTRGDQWVPTVSSGPGRTKYFSITNIRDEVLILHQDQRIGIWLAGDHVPRIPGFISIGSRRYTEWQNLAFEATSDIQSEEMEVKNPLVLVVERPEYETPRAILQRPKATLIQRLKVEASQDQDIPDCPPSDEGQDQGTSPSKCSGSDLPSMMSVQPGTGHMTGDPLNGKCTTSMSQKTDMDPSPVVEDQPDTSDLGLTCDSDQDYDECVYYQEGSDLYAEDVDGQMAVLPEVPVATEDVKIEDIQLCGSDNQTPEEVERLRQKIWKSRHLLIGKGNALLPPARGV